jgi:hypothetical protein
MLAGYYAWRSRPESARAAANRVLLDDVRRLHARHQGRYGAPRMHAALRAEGRGVSRGRIERLMRAWHPRHHRAPLFGPAPPTAATACRSRPTSWSSASRPRPRTKSGSPTSPTCRPARAGCTWRLCSTWRAARSWGGPCATTCAQSSPRPPSSWPPSGSGRRRGSPIIVTAVASTPQANTAGS